MLVLALANLSHRKIRSCLSILAVAIAITLLLVLVGLATGTLNDVSDRMQSVQAEILVRDAHFDLGSMTGGKLWDKEIPLIQNLTLDAHPAVQRVMPVFLGRVQLAGLSQNVFGVQPEDFKFFAGDRKLVVGTVFRDLAAPNPNPTLDATEPVTVPLIIDERLSHASGLKLGDTTEFADLTARVVGIVQTGVAGRVFAPINLLRSINGVGGRTAHMFFVKAANGLNTEQLQRLCEKIETVTHRDASLVALYGQVLAENYRPLTIFMSLVSIIALVICFLFILVTIYTSVLERGREMAILQSLGAARHTIMRQTLQESLIICIIGTLVGIILAYAARTAIETFQPLMNVEIKPYWLMIAALVGLAGGIVSALYPSYLALRQDPVVALSYE